MLQKIEKSTISEQIIRQIKEIILRGEIKPGEKLPPEREMAEIFSVSRSSVREAIRALQYMGILDIRSNDGIYLNNNINILADHLKFSYLLKKFSFMELVEVRKILEVGVVRLVAERATEEAKLSLHSIFEESLSCQDENEKYVIADYAFHEALAEATQNSLLVDMLQGMKLLLLESNIELVKNPGQIQKATTIHKAILNAIDMGAPDLAEREMLIHFKNVSETLDVVSQHEFDREVREKA